MSDTEKHETSAAEVVFVFVILAPAIIWGGFVFQHIWNWFAAPFSPVVLSLPHAVGLSSLIGLIRGARKSDREGGAGRIVELMVLSGLTLLIGWIAHLCMAGH